MSAHVAGTTFVTWSRFAHARLDCCSVRFVSSGHREHNQRRRTRACLRFTRNLFKSRPNRLLIEKRVCVNTVCARARSEQQSLKHFIRTVAAAVVWAFGLTILFTTVRGCDARKRRSGSVSTHRQSSTWESSSLDNAVRRERRSWKFNFLTFTDFYKLISCQENEFMAKQDFENNVKLSLFSLPAALASCWWNS